MRRADPIDLERVGPRRRAAAGSGPDPVDRVLRRTFGHRRLRAGQERVIRRVLDPRSTLAVMPTGAGKSLCYQIPALLFDGLTVVVSPLIALMKDQCDGLRELGIAAVQVHSALSAAEAAESDAGIADGSAKVVFTTPEQLTAGAFTNALNDRGVDLLVVDEAHCISQWGFDFRPNLHDRVESLATEAQNQAVQRFFLAGRDPSAAEFAAVCRALEAGASRAHAVAVAERCDHCDDCRHLARHLAESAGDAAALGVDGASTRPVERDTALATSTAAKPPFAPGAGVRTCRHGRGTVIARGATSVTVEFANGEQRGFQPRFLKAA